MDCPCCSGASYETCCQPWHAGAAAPTAEALMRSRYVAFVRRDIPYLLRTTHLTLRAKLTPKDFLRTFALGWKSLEIVAVKGGAVGDTIGVVQFKATHATGVHEETSRFCRAGSDWVYRDDRGII